MSLIINGIKVAGRGKDGVGVASGGTKGQVLTKRNNIDYDTEWTDLPSIDETLTIPGQAADARVVGDMIKDVNASIDANTSSIEAANATIATKADQSNFDALSDEVSTLSGNLNTLNGNLTTHVDNADVHITEEERIKLSDIEDGANKTVVDTELSSTSSNPVENKVINDALNTMKSDFEGSLSVKQDRDLIVTFADTSKTTATKSSEEIYNIIQLGNTVYFNNGATNFNYLEGAPSVVAFYNNYFNNDIMRADIYLIRGNAVSIEHFQNNIITQEDINTSVNKLKNDLLNGAGAAYDTLKELGDLIVENTDAIEALETIAVGKADSDHNHDDMYYTETEIDNMVFITVEDIDLICGGTIQYAEEVLF